MKHVDLILQGGTYLTMNDEFVILDDGALAVKDSKIVALDKQSVVLADYTADTTIDCTGQYVLPGLVNAHTHVPMTLLRGMADDLRLDVWLMGYIMPVEREFVSPEFCYLGTLLACAEMIRGGTTSFSDMYYYESDIARATAETGLRALLCESILKFPVPDAATYEESLAYTRDFIESWYEHPLITPSLAPHAPYSTTDEILHLSREIALEYKLPVMIHLAETQREVDDNMQQRGKTVIPWVKDTGLLDVPVIGAHCVHIDEHEMRMLRKYNASVAHCPSANLKLASGIAPISEMLAMGLNVAIGTDGPASNNDLDMFEEMRLAALLAKVTPQNPVSLPARQALQMATINGAKALGLGEVTGSLEPGKFADVIVVDTRPPHNSPRYTFNPDAPYSQIVYSTKSSDVLHTIVHGKVLMQNRQLTTIDEADIIRQAESYAEKIGQFMLAQEENPLRKLVAVSVDVERQESFEIQMKAQIDDPSIVEGLFDDERVEILRSVHYRQYDTYFIFNEPERGRLRYREDDKIDSNGDVASVRMRLTYTTAEKENIFNDAVVLSHSRFIAPAGHPLRFYQEYFRASETRELQKDRRRWRVLYKGVLFFLNVDRFLKPKSENTYLEIKARTWSKTDAENKAEFIHEMMDLLGIDISKVRQEDYLEMAQED